MNQDIFIVNGSHDAEKLLNLLYSFISKFVLCSKCKNPETSLMVSNQIRQKCIACGHEATIPKTLHKLTNYIINHPPDGTNPTLNGVSSSSGNTRKGTEKNTSIIKKEENKTTKEIEEREDDGNDFDDEEFTTEAYIERQRELSDGKYDYSCKEKANIFFSILKEKKDSSNSKLLLDMTTINELYKEAIRLEIKDKATLVLIELLLSKDNILSEIKSYRMLFLRFCQQNQKAQKYLLGAYEKLVGDLYKEDLFNSCMKILKQFYDENILDEEVIIEWAKKPSKKYVSKEVAKNIRDKVEPFIRWLKEAEVDSDDDNQNENEKKNEYPSSDSALSQNHKERRKQSEEDEDEQEEEDEEFVDFSHRVSGIRLENSNEKHKVQGKVGQKDADDETDFDIDNI